MSSSIKPAGESYFQTLIGILPDYKQEIEGIVKKSETEQTAEKVNELLRDFVYLETPDNEQLSEARCVANEQYPNAWKWYVRKNCENVKREAYGKDPNLFFGQECHQAVLEQLNHLKKSPETVSLSDTYAFFAQKRRETAEKTNTVDAHKFGTIRNDDCFNYSEMTHGLAHYNEKSRKRLLESIQGKTPKHLAKTPLTTGGQIKDPEKYRVYFNDDDNSYIGTYINEKGEEELAFFFNVEKLPHPSGYGQVPHIVNRIVYSEAGYRIFKDDAAQYEFFYFMGLNQRASTAGTIYHCPARTVPKLFAQAEEIFKKILSYKKNTRSQEVLDLIAELQWLLANAMRSDRGNAAITENITILLLLYHGFYPSPYKEGIIGDMEALTRGKKEFIRHFSSFREIPYMISPAEKRIIHMLGSYRNYANLPTFPYDPSKHDGWTHYPQIPASDVSKPLMKATDRFNRRFVVAKDKDQNVHLFFQRCTAGSLWVYSRNQGATTECEVERMPFDVLNLVTT